MRHLLLAASLLAAPAFAQAPANVPAGTYKVDPGHTQVLFTVTHFGVSEYTGQFVQPAGSLTLDPAHPEKDRLDVTFPIAKISTTVAKLDEHLQAPDFFDAARFPEGRFTATSVKVNGTNATIAGNLTLKGVTKPVVLDARFVGAAANPMSKKLNIGFQATTTIQRSAFGISYGIPMVSDAVRLTINAAFEAE